MKVLPIERQSDLAISDDTKALIVSGVSERGE